MLKRLLFISAIAAMTTTNYSQVVSDSVTMGAGYADQVYYDLATGTKTASSSTDWDLQFFSSLFAVSIRVNGGQGVELYEAVSTDTTNFASATLDTSSLTNLYDGFASWEQDAFTSQATFHPNYGWGQYNSSSHNIEGDKVYAIKLTSGVFKKIWIKSFVASGNVIFALADLDGSNMITKTVNRSSYSTKRHFYYDVENDSIIDPEPTSANWDFVFRKYTAVLAPGVYYNVTGALTNANIGVAQVDNTPTADARANYSSYALDSTIEVLGWDWKSYSFTTGWSVTDSLSYIMKDYNEDVWQVIFTGTGGSTDGKMYFTKERIAIVSLEENSPVSNLGVYPNPTTGVLNVNFELVNSNNTTQIMMYDMNGRVVKTISNNFTNSGFTQLTTNISDLENGVYFVTIRSGNNSITKRVIKQ